MEKMKYGVKGTKSKVTQSQLQDTPAYPPALPIPPQPRWWHPPALKPSTDPKEPHGQVEAPMGHDPFLLQPLLLEGP